MGRKTKYCLNYANGRHLNDGKSPSGCYCSVCYQDVKKRLETTQQQGGPIEGLRGARTLAGGSFGYEQTKEEKERNLRAFFHYVMPHIHGDRARQLAKEIAEKPGVNEYNVQSGGYKRIRHW